MDEPFKRIAMDIVGHLNRSTRDHKFILVLCDYGTKYFKAVSLNSQWNSCQCHDRNF